MNLNQVIVEGTLQRWSSDDGPVSYKVKYSVDGTDHDNVLLMAESLSKVCCPFVGKIVRIVGRLEGRMIAVEHIDLGD